MKPIESEIYWSINKDTPIPPLSKIKGKMPKDIHGAANVKPKPSKYRHPVDSRLSMTGRYQTPNRETK